MKSAMEPETRRLMQTSTATPWILMGIGYGVPMGAVFSWQTKNWIAGMTGGLVAGVIFALVMRWFAARVGKKFAKEPPDFGGDTVLLEGASNHFQGAEGVGGYLWLTSGQLVFRSHRFNLQNHECRMPLSEIAAVEATKTLGLIPNGLLVHLTSGSKERFVVNRNSQWATAIQEARSSREETKLAE